tara:strand:+ start:23186 stop:24673 length:1488 start_codon:yes stop_codon:yes gene_type:complete
MRSNFLKHKREFDDLVEVVNILIQRNKLEQAAETISKIALYTTKNQTGYYASLKLEKLIGLIAQKIDFKSIQVHTTSNSRRVLHVVTELYHIGGHSRLLKNWIKRDQDSEHTIVATSMLKNDLDNIIAFWELTGVKTFAIEGSIIKKAIALNTFSEGFDFIILHIHQYDIIPSLSFSSFERNRLPIFFMNHADHTFWIGRLISNAIICYRENILKLDALRRGISPEDQFYLPLPIQEYKSAIDPSSKSDFKKELNLSEDSIVLLCVSSLYKFTPYDDINFFKDVIKVLEKDSRLILLIIGVNEGDRFTISHKRIKFLGIKKDIGHYLQGADIYIENFPYGSYTSVLDAMNYNLPVQLMHTPNETLSIFPEKEGFSYPKSYDEWEKKLLNLINDVVKQKELINIQKKHLEKNNYQELWKEKLNNLYKLQKGKIEITKDDMSFNTSIEIFYDTLKHNAGTINYKDLFSLFSFKDFILNKALLNLFIKNTLVRLKNKF